MEIYKFGVAQDIVAELTLDYDALLFLCHSLPQADTFTKDCWDALDRIDSFQSHLPPEQRIQYKG